MSTIADEKDSLILVLTGPQALTQVEQVRIIGDVIGRPLRYEEISPEAAREQMFAAGLPPSFADSALNYWATLVTEPELITSTVGRDHRNAGTHIPRMGDRSARRLPLSPGVVTWPRSEKGVRLFVFNVDEAPAANGVRGFIGERQSILLGPDQPRDISDRF